MPKHDQKQLVINEIKEKLNRASSVVLVDGRGLTVEQDTTLRRKLREAGVDYKVYKNTLMSFALKDTAFEGLDQYLAGPTTAAICYDDPIVGAKVIQKEQKDMKALEFKAGFIDGVCYDAAGMVQIASIPGREELLSRLLGSFKSPMASFARLAKAIAEKE